MMKVKDICSLQNGRAFKPADWRPNGLPIVRIQNLNDESAPFNYYAGEYNPVHEINDGELLFSWSGTPGTSFGAFRWFRGKGVLNQHIFRVIPKIDVDKEYLKYALNGNIQVIIAKAHGGVGLQHITKKELDEIEIRIPSIRRQQEIVAILSKVEGLIKHKKQELQWFNDIIKARFVELFESRNYPIEKLGNICSKITDGTHKTPNYLEAGITFISAKNIINGELNFSDVKYISEEEYQSIQKRCQTEKLDILLSKSGSLGSPVIVKTDEKLGLFESLAVLKYDRDKIVPEFLCEQIKTDRVQRQFTSGTKGVAIKHLHLGVISDTDVIVPSMDEQKEFARFVKKVDKSKSAVQKALDETQVLFDSLMQEYFG